MTVTVLGGILLMVAIMSLVVYLLALGRLLTRPRRPGLVRTAACRVGAAVLYVVVGLTATLGYHGAPVVALATFIAVQLVWQSNAIADVALARHPMKPVSDPRQHQVTPSRPDEAATSVSTHRRHPRHYLGPRDLDNNGGG